MSGEIAQILHQSAGDTRALVQLIQVHGGTVIPAEENRQLGIPFDSNRWNDLLEELKRFGVAPW